MKLWTKKKSYILRLLSAIICLLVLASVVPFQMLGAAFLTAPEVSVTVDGAAVSEIILPQTDKITLTANASPEKRDTAFQWQILTGTQNGEWVNILDATAKELTLSYAVVESLLDNSGSVCLRASAQNGEYTGYSAPVAVTVHYNVPEDETALLSPAPQAIELRDAADESNSEYVHISINYLDSVTGRAIYNGFSAQIQKGTSYTNSVISPTYLGYAPCYNPDHPAIGLPDEGEVDASADASIIRLDIPESFDGDSYVVNVYYKPIKVLYAARYFFQNINDDFYSEDLGLYKQDYATTGTIISNKQLEASDPDKTQGFTKLYHYPEAVAADGSTVFECYYDRNYYILNFDMNGGYGTEPVYARYGAPFLTTEPTKHGYTFVGWDLLEDGVGDGSPDPLPSTIPAENQTYKAIWQPISTQYTTVYWIQNADNDNYSYMGRAVRYADAGSFVSGSDGPMCDSTDEGHTHTSACYPNEHFEFQEADQNVEVKGDGSTIVNVRYTRKYYTLRFIYAKEYNGAYDCYNPSGFNGISYAVVGGSTHGFGNQNTTRRPWPNGTGNDYSLDDIIYNMNKTEGNSEQWGTIYETMDQTEDLSRLPQIIQPSVENAAYSTGVYPEPGTGYTGSAKGNTGNGNYNIQGDRFYYFDLTARYGADLSQLWPAAVFDKVKVAHPDKHIDNGGADNLKNDGWGNYAFLAGWNGEYKVTYSLRNDNSTIKGNYQKLDDTVLFGALGDKTFTYDSDRIITTTATVGGKKVTSRVNYFVNFFNNGKGVSWNVPREWNYDLFVPIFDGELTADQITTVQQYGNDKKTCDIGGYTYYYYKLNNTIYRLFDQVVTSDDGTVAKNQTQTALEGFAFEDGDLSDYCARAEKIDNGTLTDGRTSYTVRFFYKRDTFDLVKHNHNEQPQTESDVEFDSDVDRFVYDDDGDQIVPSYPTTLKKGAYVFRGWYESPGCYDGTEYTAGTRMPASDFSLYAKWEVVSHTVWFFKDYDSMLNFQNYGDESGLIETRSVPHESVVGDIDDAEDSDYDFSGWFQMKKEEKTAFSPPDTPIINDTYVFADWGSQSAQPYVIHYALDIPETDESVLTLLNAAANGMPEDNTEYTVTVNGVQTKYVYLDSDGRYHLSIADRTKGFAYQGNTRTFHPKTGNPYDQLWDGYNNGYYPTLASHSISIRYEADKENPQHNVFTFTYVHMDRIDYTVEYRRLDTGAYISSAPGNGKVDKQTSLSVVTERFAVVTDMIPDAFYKRLILAVEKQEDGSVISSPDNVVTFYYSQNSVNAFYAVHHMLQNIDAASDLPQSDGSGGYTNYTENKAHTEGIGKIGEEIRVAPQSFIGFTVYGKGQVKGEPEFTDLQDTSSDHPYFNITIEAEGTELYIFYTRNIQNYKIYHLRYGTNISNLDALEYNATDQSNGILTPIENGSGKNGSTVTASCKTSAEIPGMSCVSEFTKSIVLRANDSQNYILFYYSPLQFTVEYKVWQFGGGSLDKSIEVVNGTDPFTGSSPTAQTGYSFEGWYLDEACTQPAVSTPAADDDKATLSEDRLIPTTANLDPIPKINAFYAKFLPTYGDLTITRQNGADGQSGGEQTFVYKLTSVQNPEHVLYASITGNGSAVIKNLPCGDYVIEQVNGWSWRYSDGKKTVSLPQEGCSVRFDAEAENESWLNANSKKNQNRKG